MTLCACIAHEFASSKSPVRYASEASCNASNAVFSNRLSGVTLCAICRSNLLNGSLGMRRSVDF